jgi:hypothetical protein
MAYHIAYTVRSAYQKEPLGFVLEVRKKLDSRVISKCCQRDIRSLALEWKNIAFEDCSGKDVLTTLPAPRISQGDLEEDLNGDQLIQLRLFRTLFTSRHDIPRNEARRILKEIYGYRL